MTGTERLHHGVRVYVRSQPRRAYLSRVIAPIARDLAVDFGAQRIHVSPGWRNGAHFDVRAVARPGRPITWGPLGVALADGAARHRAPASDISDEEYLRTATLLGQIEAVPPPYLPRHPHGHTELLAPPPPSSGSLEPHREAGLAHLLTPLAAAASVESDGAVLARVAEAFLALAATHPHGVRFGTFSFRSHAEAFFHYAGPRADYRASFDKRMGKDRAVLEELVGRECHGERSAQGALWCDAFHACMADFDGKVTEEDIDRAIPADTGPARRTAGRSPFHAAVEASGVIDSPPPWFAGYRLTTNLFYQLLPALDISPVRRFYLCHAIAETVDAVFGESWQTRLAAVEAMMAQAR